jgi:hypothetical protein
MDGRPYRQNRRVFPRHTWAAGKLHTTFPATKGSNILRKTDSPGVSFWMLRFGVNLELLGECSDRILWLRRTRIIDCHPFAA